MHEENDETKTLLRFPASVDPNVRNASGNTPLCLAIKEGHKDAVAALCEAGAKVDAIGCSNNTALHVAAKWGKEECVEVMCEIKNNICIQYVIFTSEHKHNMIRKYYTACIWAAL